MREKELHSYFQKLCLTTCRQNPSYAIIVLKGSAQCKKTEEKLHLKKKESYACNVLLPNNNNKINNNNKNNKPILLLQYLNKIYK